VKQTKISILQNQFSSFKMKPNETVSDMYMRFQTIQHDLMVLGVQFTQFGLVTRILNSLTNEWERKVLVIEEANNLSVLRVKELIGNLMPYEANLQARKEANQEKKNMAFQASNENSDLEEDEVVFIAKNYNKFKKFKKMTKFRNGRNSNSNSTDQTSIKYFGCDKFGHMSKDCPQENNYKRKNKIDFKKKKRAFQVIWDDSNSSSSSDSESDTKQVNVCFMAN